MTGWLDPPDLSIAGRRRALLRLFGIGLSCGWLGVCLLALAFVPGGRGRSRRAEAAGRTAGRCLRLLGLEVEMQGVCRSPPSPSPPTTGFIGQHLLPAEGAQTAWGR